MSITRSGESPVPHDTGVARLQKILNAVATDSYPSAEEREQMITRIPTAAVMRIAKINPSLDSMLKRVDCGDPERLEE